MATVKGSTNMRTLGGVKAPIIAAVEEGTDVLVLQELDGWSRIETADGYYGYVEYKYLSETRQQEMEPVNDVAETEPQYRSVDGRICMAWNIISFDESNASIDGMLVGTKGINILAPTWFTLTDDDGTVNVKASKTYVKMAHEKKMMIWAVLDNFQNETGTVCTEFLNTFEGRQKVIKKVVEEALAFNIDGINVDLEGLTMEHGADFVEFVREISIACRRAGLYISIDNYVPYNYNDYANLLEQAKFADYVVIMGYDEHYAGSEERGEKFRQGPQDEPRLEQHCGTVLRGETGGLQALSDLDGGQKIHKAETGSDGGKETGRRRFLDARTGDQRCLGRRGRLCEIKEGELSPRENIRDKKQTDT